DYAGGLAAIRYILEYGGAEIDFGVPSFRYNLGSRIAYRESLVFPSVFTSEHQQIFAVTPNNRGTHRQTCIFSLAIYPRDQIIDSVLAVVSQIYVATQAFAPLCQIQGAREGVAT